MDMPDIVPLDEPTAAFRQGLLAALWTVSDPKAGQRPWPAHSLCLAIRDAAGAVAGGLYGYFRYDWLFIELIFVPEDRRGQDLGSALLAIAQAQARAWGAVGVWLDTFSFQARGFYERHGFAVFGGIADYPAPHERFFLNKRLDPAGPRAAAHPAIERIAEPAPDHREAISGALGRFNDARIGGGDWPDVPLAFALRHGEGGSFGGPSLGGPSRGGLWGRSYYNWLFVDLLVVPEHLQGQGIGAGLLGRAEAAARARGCTGVWLDTFSFQAPAFYVRHGYEAFGEIANYPAPHRRLFLSKRL
jgi:GNAT superfamily N-acetyltransferase